MLWATSEHQGLLGLLSASVSHDFELGHVSGWSLCIPQVIESDGLPNIRKCSISSLADCKRIRHESQDGA